LKKNTFSIFFLLFKKNTKQKVMAWRSNNISNFTSARWTHKFEKLRRLTDNPQRFDKTLVTIITIYNNVLTDNRGCESTRGGGGGGTARETFKTEIRANGINHNGKSHLLLSLYSLSSVIKRYGTEPIALFNRFGLRIKGV